MCQTLCSAVGIYIRSWLEKLLEGSKDMPIGTYGITWSFTYLLFIVYSSESQALRGKEFSSVLFTTLTGTVSGT